MSDQPDNILAALTRLEHGQAALTTEMATLRTDLGTEIATLRTDLGAEMATLGTDLGTRIAAVRTDLTTEINTLRMDFLSELGTTRGQIMERLDGHQNRLESMFADIGVNWHNTDRVERKVDADREETRLLVSIVNELTRAVRTLQSRITILEDKS